MGNARRRGTFEQRQMQAIKAGRVQPEPAEPVLGRTVPGLVALPAVLGLLLSLGGKKRQRKDSTHGEEEAERSGRDAAEHPGPEETGHGTGASDRPATETDRDVEA